jgi:glycogen operon protein
MSLAPLKPRPSLSFSENGFQFEIREEGRSAVISLFGQLSSSIPSTDREAAANLIRSKQSTTIDFSGLTGFTGSGLRRLLQFCRWVRSLGVELKAFGASEELLKLAGAAGFVELLRESAAFRPAGPGSTLRSRIDAYPTHYIAGYAVRAGEPLPFGARKAPGGVNFSIFSRHATACTLVLFEPGKNEPFAEVPFPPEFRIGDVFAMTVFDVDPENLEYGFRLDGPFDPSRGHRFDKSKVVLDPEARCASGRDVWGKEPDPGRDPVYRGRLVPDDFDWENDQPLNLPFEDLVIYEAHVRGFTRSESSDVVFPGTFAGLREKIPYLKELGINCLELLPIFQFDELDNSRQDPNTGERLFNYWGYNTVAFNAPHAGFAATASMGTHADEFRTLVKALHKSGIEVMLDVVFNHTAEGNEQGPTLSFRGLDNRTYYMLSPEGRYLNFSGCGNTFNCNHPVVRNFVLDCLRHWVAEYHVDGFRFDLASILGRAPDGTPLPNPPLLEALAMDPVLSRTKLVAEAWDAGGLYQVGAFPAYGRWAEWNGKYRDCVRKAIKGDLGQMPELAERIAGSPDLYWYRGATASINFVTCHDGFTLADLVSYDGKHNEANGENNQDGGNDNHSWNCGVEGPTDDPNVLRLRRRQMKNALTTLLVSQGVPMLLMGDEVARTQNGNNNAYCHDGPLNWLDWNSRDRNEEVFRFCRRMIAFRARHPALRSRQHAGADGSLRVEWHGTRVDRPDWFYHSRTLALSFSKRAGENVDVVYAAFNFYWEPLEFEAPPPPHGYRWHVAADTGKDPPHDAHESGEEPALEGAGPLVLTGRSAVVLFAVPTPNS